MTDLIKELRELHAKTTQGEWSKVYESCSTVCLETNLEECESFSEGDNNFICKAHNELSKLLDGLEFLEKVRSAQAVMIKRKLDELDRYKKALEKRRSQMGYLLIGNNIVRYMGVGDSSKEVAEQLDLEIDRILEGEVSG